MTQRLWFKIGDAAAQVGVNPKELRYWEDVIPELCPRRSKGNLRYYHLDDLPRLKRIKDWLSEGLTVADCAELLTHGHLVQRLDLGLDLEPTPAAPKGRTKAKPRAPRVGTDLQPILRALRILHEHLSKPPKRR